MGCVPLTQGGSNSSCFGLILLLTLMQPRSFFKELSSLSNFHPLVELNLFLLALTLCRNEVGEIEKSDPFWRANFIF